MNTSKKTVLVACSVASLAVLPVYLRDAESQAMATPLGILPTIAATGPADEIPPVEPEPTTTEIPLPPTDPVPPTEPVPTPTESPVPPTDPVPPVEPVPTPTEIPVPPTDPVPPVEPVPTPTESPVPPTDPVPPTEPVPTPTESPVPPTEPVPPTDPVPTPTENPQPPTVGPAPVASPQPAEPAPVAPGNNVPVTELPVTVPSAQPAPVVVQPRAEPTLSSQVVATPTPSLQVLGAQPPAKMDADTSRVDRSPAGGSVLGLTKAPQQNYSGAPDWVEGFLNSSSNQKNRTDASNQAAGVMGAEAQGHQLEPTGTSNVFQRGISIVTGARPLLIFSGVAVAGLALVVFNFVWRNRTPKA